MKKIPVELYDHENCDDKVWYGQDLLVSRNVQDNAELPKFVNCQQYGLILLTEGDAEYQINLKKQVLRSPMLWFASPNTVWEFSQSSARTAIRGCLVAVSENLFKKLQIITSHELRDSVTKKPFLELSEAERQVFLSYLDLIYHLAHLSSNYRNDQLIYSVLQSFFLYFLHLFEQKEMDSRPHKKQSRSDYICGEFVRLTKIYASKQHSIGFYASQLRISEKYLSNIVKRVTQKPPRKWIDEILLKEAIYMLYDENKSIQQISNALSFSSPSLFGVFFKRKTGMSPMEYRRMLG
ncbi:MAG: AraC family transcriptional regulator [Bacteroidales bacterium]|nr:AraC family transcriptional regulator [Bacteroidales bacterium]